MNISGPFIVRPVATTLIWLGVVLAGWLAHGLLPIAPLPQIELPVISVRASMPGASPEVMAATVATPLERSLGTIAGVTEMTSRSTTGQTRITLQFDLSRDIDSAATDVQGAINAARAMMPSGLPSNPSYRKANPSAAPIMTLALTSATLSQGQLYDIASTTVQQNFLKYRVLVKYKLVAVPYRPFGLSSIPMRSRNMGCRWILFGRPLPRRTRQNRKECSRTMSTAGSSRRMISSGTLNNTDP